MTPIIRILWCAAILIAFALFPSMATAKAGAPDLTFGNAGKVITPVDLGFRSDGVRIAEGAEGNILVVCGRFLARYLPDGELDPTFGEGGILELDNPEGLEFWATGIAVDSKDRIVVFGEAIDKSVMVPGYYDTGLLNPSLVSVLRYDHSGRVDTTFGGGDGAFVTDFGLPPYWTFSGYDKAYVSPTAGVIGPAGGLNLVVALREFGTENETGRGTLIQSAEKPVARLTPEGEIDPTFGPGTGVIFSTRGWSIVGLAFSGKGELTVAASNLSFAGVDITRLHSDGRPDLRFGPKGTRFFPLPTTPRSIAFDSRGRTLVQAGKTVLRLTPEGRVDRGFGRDGRATALVPRGTFHVEPNVMAVDSSGGILLAGTAVSPPSPNRFEVSRLGPSGRPDRTFGRGGWTMTGFGGTGATVEDALIDRTGRLVVAGNAFLPGRTPDTGFVLARYRLNY